MFMNKAVNVGPTRLKEAAFLYLSPPDGLRVPMYNGFRETEALL